MDLTDRNPWDENVLQPLFGAAATLDMLATSGDLHSPELPTALHMLARVVREAGMELDGFVTKQIE